MTYLIIERTATAIAVSRFLRQRGELVFQGEENREVATDSELPDLLGELVPPAAADARVIWALPFSQLFSRELDMELRDRRKLREILPIELRGETALESDELVFDGLPLASDAVLALWGRKHDLATAIRIGTEAGAEPEAVTASPLHWQLLLPDADRTGTVALCDGTALAVYRDGEPLFFRPLPGGVDEIDRTLASLEIGKGITIDRLYLHGALAPSDMPAAGTTPIAPLPLTGALAAAFGDDEATARRRAGAWALAEALHADTIISFRSGDLAYTKGRERLKRQLRLPAILALLLLVLLAADSGLRYTLVKRDLASLNASIGAIYHELFPTRKKSVDEVAELRAEIRKLGAASARSAVLDTMKKLAEAKGNDISGLYEVEIDGSQLRVKGDARSAQAVSDFKNRLAGFVSGTELGPITSKPDGSVTFSIRGSIKEAGQ
ncbi:type II secretion system protein GspL [Geotalea uraniireducens]|uniref:Type II secretion system protein GspL n=1 Tax=Geotalea uraniireducens TaxID=351604 RepID=A0ABM8EQ78_9BACT|nr:type II secretion system protein GspL [Geotalea uraniireducens]BDV44775.1 type II secretion system protein GspL [Geotalea uraniireducens]